MELTLDQALQKGIEAHKAGRAQEADRYYTAIIKANPKHPDANHNMGVLAIGVGKVQEALPFFKTALETNPSKAQYWLSYIDALIKLDRKTDAKAVFDQAKSKGAKGDGFDKLEKRLILSPSINSNTQEPPQDQLQSLINLYTQSQYKAVVAQASQVLEQFPYSINLYIISGAAYQGLGKLKEAVQAYNKAIDLKPDCVEAYNNMGVALKEQGKLEEAIGAYNKALSIKPDYVEAYNNIGIALNGINFTKPNKDLQKTVTSLLEKATYVRPKDIAKATISLLKLEPTLQKYLQISDDGVLENPVDVISDLSEFPLLLRLMSVCPVPDLEFEKLFKKLRCFILSNITVLEEVSSELLGFQSALALQCFTNEYIYNNPEEEEKILKSLEASVRKALENNEQPSPQLILSLAAYKPLNEYDWCNFLVITDEIQEVFSRQVEEPQKEVDLKSCTPVLEKITNSISSTVRAQYEENPFPRWVNLGLTLKPMLISEVIGEVKLKLHHNKITEVEKPEILIAGCGTGQHSIGTAKRFKGSKVLAIDLSLSSLAYAKRKTDELSIENIEYMQADILDLGKLNKKFDIIESAGVLHHMDNPMEGWQLLTDCLKPGGLMKIGLYSELARQHIVKIRHEIKQKDIATSDASIKCFRDMIIKSNKDHHKEVLQFSDFYSLSELKDLLFHVQEHQFTIPKIKDHLDKLGLKFCGFEEKQTVAHFRQSNKTDNDPYDLYKWEAYEEANPKAFAGMYQFWCQKVE